MGWCKYCEKKRPTAIGDEGFVVCIVCGCVVDQNIYVEEVTFTKSAGGQSQLSGSFVKSVQSEFSESRERTLMKGRDEISYLVSSLNVGGGDSIIDQASNFYRLAVEKNFTRGRTTSLVAATCLYIACRENKKPYLLIDFSEQLRINVYVLGAVFLQLCHLLRLQEHHVVQKPVDPSLFIHRFTEHLLGGKNAEVSRNALLILASMKRDWMQTGRKPSGLCGAALYISALSQGIRCSKSDIGRVVHTCEATLRQRLIEFESTEAAGLTIEEFVLKAEELEREARQMSNMNAEPSGEKNLLCEHKGSGKSHFAHGLCRTCYDDFIELSGGLCNGSAPPAFQRAESKRMAKSKSRGGKKAKTSSLSDNEIDTSSESIESAVENENLGSQWSENIVVASKYHTVDRGVAVHSHEYGGMDDSVGDQSESFSDLDEDEVDGYILNDEEKSRKRKIWEEVNKDYEEEQRLKKAIEEASNKAYEANYQNCSEESRALLMELNTVNAKKRKERREKRAADATNAASVQSATEAVRKMVARKRLSSKINYDALSKLFDDSREPETPEYSKKQRIESDSKGETVKSDLQDGGYDIGQENEYGEGYNDADYNEEGYNDADYNEEEYNGGQYTYSDDLYQATEVEYGYYDDDDND